MKRVWVTRPEPDNVDTVARLAAIGITAFSTPLMTRHNLQTSLPSADGFAGMIVTSANALRALNEREVLSNYVSLPLFAVGDKTAAAAARFGFKDIIVGEGDADSLIALLSAHKKTGALFYPAANVLSRDIAAALAPRGVLVITSAVYEMRPVTTLQNEIISDLQNQSINAVLFYSRRSAQLFCDLMEQRLTTTQRAALTMICLSENVAAPLLGAKFARIALADYPSEEGMMAVSLSFARDQIRS